MVYFKREGFFFTCFKREVGVYATTKHILVTINKYGYHQSRYRNTMKDEALPSQEFGSNSFL
jgi:hypothetical protein